MSESHDISFIVVAHTLHSQPSEARGSNAKDHQHVHLRAFCQHIELRRRLIAKKWCHNLSQTLKSPLN